MSHASYFERLFPVPDFLDPPLFGVSFTSSRISYVRLERRSTGLFPVVFGEVFVPAETYGPKGEINRPDALLEILKKMAREKNMRSVACSFSEEQVYIFTLELPFMDESKLYGALELALEEHVPIPPQDTLFDYAILRRPATAKETYRIAVTAVPRLLVETYMSILEKAGLHVVSFETNAHAIARAVIAPDERGLTLLVDISARSTVLTVCDQQSPVFSSVVPFGVEAFFNAACRVFPEQGDGAKKSLIEIGLSRLPEHEALFTSLVPVTSALKDEISKVYLYWKNKKGDQAKDQSFRAIALSGMCAGLPGLAEYLSSDLGVLVEPANVWQNALSLEGDLPEITREESLHYASAVGLGLRRGIYIS